MLQAAPITGVELLVQSYRSGERGDTGEEDSRTSGAGRGPAVNQKILTLLGATR